MKTKCHSIIIVLIIASMLQCSGCATLYTQISDHNDANDAYGFTVPRAYSGTVLDCHALGAENIGFFALVDLPLSLVLDTILFPYTIVRQIRLGNIE
jgi:uncharacterized protein YceK